MMKRFITFLFILISLSGMQPPSEEPIRVGVVLLPPFAMLDNGKPKGIAIDLWREIARRGDFQYKFVTFSENAEKIVDLVSKNQVDIGIGPISITSNRIKKVDFTISYFNTRVNLIIKKQSIYLIYGILNFVRSFMYLIAAIMMGFLIYVTLYWVFERDKHEEFPKSYLRTVGHFFWSHMVVHKIYFIPQTWGGKMGSLIWAFFSMFFIASLLASLTSYFFLVIQSTSEPPFKNPTELHSKVLTAVKGQYNYVVAQRWSSSVVPAPTFKDALDMIKTGKVFGVVAEHYPSKYVLDHDPELSDLHLANLILDRTPVAFAVRYGDPLRVKINGIITNMQREDMGASICAPYLGNDAQECMF